MFCTHCGSELSQANKFCSNCGAASNSEAGSSDKPVKNYSEKKPPTKKTFWDKLLFLCGCFVMISLFKGIVDDNEVMMTLFYGSLSVTLVVFIIRYLVQD